MTDADTVLVERDGPVTIIAIDRPERRNAVDAATAQALADAFRAFDADAALSVAILTGKGGYFCAGADLKEVATGHVTGALDRGRRADGLHAAGLAKPVIAAVEGPAVAGGFELALWCDLRVAAPCRVGRLLPPLRRAADRSRHLRLPRLIGQSRALDLILTGRAVRPRKRSPSALPIAWRSRAGRRAALALAAEIAHFPQACLRNDRLSVLEQWDLEEEDAIANEMRGGLEVIASGETLSGATRFASGVGRHGAFGAIPCKASRS